MTTKTYSDDLIIDTPEFTVSGQRVMRKVRPHDTAYSPVGLWNLNGDMTDSVGTNHLSVGAGTELYGYSNGLQGFAFNGATYLFGTNVGLITGDLTVEILTSPSRIVSTLQYIIAETGSAAVDSEPTNILWNMRSSISNGALEYLAEHSSGTNIIYTSNIVPAIGSLHHVAMIRESDVIKFYINGVLVATSGTLTTPTYSGIPLQRIEIGGTLGGATSYYQGFVASVKIFSSALNADQILREANYTLYGGI